jgi:hypothetical protein
MRYVLLLLTLVTFGNVKSQTYSKVISDLEIVDFIGRDLLRDSIVSLNPVFWKPRLNNFYYKDSADLASKNDNPEFIFSRYVMRNGKVVSDHLDTIFSRADIDFFKSQIQSISKRNRWKKVFRGTTFNEDFKLDSTNHTKQTIYRYSIPVFSLDRRHAIVIKGFYCGLLCGGGAYYLYRRTATDWELLKEFKQWGE